MHAAPQGPGPESTTPQNPGSPPVAGAVLALVALIGPAAYALVMWLTPLHEGEVRFGYRDPVGVVTACVGHTRTAQLGRRYTAQECQQLLAEDLLRHAQDLRCITAPLQPHETAALLSFVFNVGHGQAGKKDGLCVLRNGRPSTIVRMANAGNMAAACASISDWVGATRWDGTRVDCRKPEANCAGILRRRADERAMCEGRYIGGPAGPTA